MQKKKSTLSRAKNKNLKIHTGRKITQPFDLEMPFFCTDITFMY